jgi:hypothetical protein
LPHSQGQIGADGLSAFNGSDLPTGWFMPFVDMEPPEPQDVTPSGGGGLGGNADMDPFGSMFGTNGMMMPHSMHGLRHTL